ncbi:MAG: VOC family protein [Flavitalea sp.]
MKNVQSYLTFNGNCREAMLFYQSCLGGDLFIQTVKESPLSDKIPNHMKDAVLHSSLTTDNMVLLGSDMVSESGLIRGNAVSMLLNCTDEQELHDCFQKLSFEGKVLHPIEQTFFGALLGNLSDRFGNHWMLHYKRE